MLRKMCSQVPPFQEVDVFETGEAFELRNGYVRASFDRDGMLQSVTTIDDGRTTKTKLQARNSNSRLVEFEMFTEVWSILLCRS